MLFRKIIYRLLFFFRNPFKTKRLLIVRLDAIGDYVLFRNFLLPIKQSKRFSEYHFTLLGNEKFKDLALSFDQNSIDEFIWINPELVYGINNYSWKTLRLILKLKWKGFDIVIHPVHSRLIAIDRFIRYVGGKKNIASSGDEIGYTSTQEKQIGDKMYQEIIPVPDYKTFEFYRNQIFTAKLIDDRYVNSLLWLGDNYSYQQKNKKTIVIFPSAGNLHRRWSTKNYAELIHLISKEITAVEFCIAGNKTDTVLAKEIMGFAKDTSAHISDYTGKTNLSQLVDLLKHATLLISNETSAVHIAAAVQLPVICISNGNHFGRFNPYPKELRNNIETIYPHNDFYNTTKHDLNIEQNKIESDTDINLISPLKVFDVVKLFFDFYTNAD